MRVSFYFSLMVAIAAASEVSYSELAENDGECPL